MEPDLGVPSAADVVPEEAARPSPPRTGIDPASQTGIHPAWWVALVAFVALLGAAGFRAAPGVLMIPLEEEFGWPRSLMSGAVSVNLVLYGVMAPFAAALMDMGRPKE